MARFPWRTLLLIYCTLEPKGRDSYVIEGATDDAVWRGAGYLSPILGFRYLREVAA